MTESNYPPGVRESDIPGCSDEDEDWNRTAEGIMDRFSVEEIRELTGDPKVKDEDDAWGALGGYSADELRELFGI